MVAVILVGSHRDHGYATAIRRCLAFGPGHVGVAIFHRLFALFLFFAPGFVFGAGFL